MANKLAGQRAKFSRARAIFYTSSDETQRQRAVHLMADVLAEAPANDFSEDDVTQGADMPAEVRAMTRRPSMCEESADELVHEVELSVETRGLRQIGAGAQFVYAYGYPCAPDRLKIGSCAGDVVTRVAAQIGTGTPDKPALRLTIATDDCRGLERALHAILRFQGKQVAGGGAEWFRTTPEDVIDVYHRVISSPG
jgi:hypothetical protein